MAGRKPKLTPQTHQQIVSVIRAGTFEIVAARTAGIGKSTFYTWLKRGAEAKTGMYREFHDDVIRARAEARATAEIQVHKINPLSWLRLGPGRDRDAEPGWTHDLLPATAAEKEEAARRVSEEHGSKVPVDVILKRAAEIADMVDKLYDYPSDLP